MEAREGTTDYDLSLASQWSATAFQRAFNSCATAAAAAPVTVSAISRRLHCSWHTTPSVRLHMSNAPQADSATPRIHAAQYVRMSTEHQQYSTENQRDAIADFAKVRGYDVVKTYADDGKSGLSIEGRASLRQMLADVESGTAPFKAILVYDVSRWGPSLTA